MKTITKIFLGLTIIPLIIVGITVKTAPNRIEKSFQQYLSNQGLAQAILKKPEAKYGAIRYKNIQLSDNKNIEIEALTIDFNPLNLLSNPITKISINGVFISGDIDIDGQLHLSGLENLFTSRPPQQTNLSIKNINFSILSAHFGGLRGKANLSATRKDQAFVWTGNIDSRQDQLEIIAKINGQTNDSGSWIFDLEIENGKLERNFGKITRANGALSWSGKGDKWQNLRGEINAGGLVAYNTSWQNAAFAIEAEPKAPTSIKLSAKASGFENVELSSVTQANLKGILSNATIQTDTGQKAIDFFTAHHFIPLQKESLDEIAKEKDLTIIIEQRKNDIKYKLSTQSDSLDIVGQIKAQNSNQYQIIAASIKNLNEGINGADCIKKSDKNICTLNVTYKDGKYSLINQ